MTPNGLNVLETSGHTSTPVNSEDRRLRELCAELEGVFLSEMMKAMRTTVPESGLLDGGTGEEIFTSLLDQHLSGIAAERVENGIGAALYRQLRGVGGSEI